MAWVFKNQRLFLLVHLQISRAPGALHDFQSNQAGRDIDDRILGLFRVAGREYVAGAVGTSEVRWHAAAPGLIYSCGLFRIGAEEIDRTLLPKLRLNFGERSGESVSEASASAG